MYSRLAQIFALLVLGVAAPRLHAGTITFDYYTPVGSTGESGMGSFSYNGSGTSITEYTNSEGTPFGDLTSFAFELDVPNNSWDWSLDDDGLSELISFSASVNSSGVLTALSLSTNFVPASNPADLAESAVDFVVTSLASGGAATFTYLDILNKVEPRDTGTVTQTPEPSTALLAGGGALLLAFWRRALRAPRG
jgi:PEP-CTERM motif